ncbi:MAG: UbiX family flavin prenyltransferase [Burkholderiaceae bacterium]
MGQSAPVIVAITGASGARLGVRLLAMLGELGIERHLIVSAAGWMNIEHELGVTRAEIIPLAERVHPVRDIGACVASGSFPVGAMVIAPCSMRTLAAVALGLSDNLITRAADVTLKERRRLLIVPRETPLNLAHLRNMVSVTEMGGIVFPPVPAFYAKPAGIEELVDQLCARMLDCLGLEHPAATRWQGLRERARKPDSEEEPR